MSENQEVVNVVTAAITGFFLAWKVVELFSFIGMSGGLIQTLINIKDAIWKVTGAKIVDKIETMYLTALYAKDFLVGIVTNTKKLIEQAKEWIIVTGLKVIDAIKTGIVAAAQWVWNAAATVGSVVTTALGAAFAFLTSPIGLVILAIAAIVAIGVLLWKNWDKIKEFAINIWGAISGFFSNTMNNIKNTFIGGFNRVKDGITNIFNGIKNTVSNIANGLVAILKTPLNAIINLINGAISGVNRLKINIPDWVPFLGGKSFGINIPKIPMLAQGGYVGPNQPQPAIIGDNKRYGEIVAPENKMEELLNKAVANGGSNIETNTLLKEMLSVLLQILNTGDGKIEVDGEVFAKVIGTSIDNYRRNNGKLPFEI